MRRKSNATRHPGAPKPDLPRPVGPIFTPTLRLENAWLKHRISHVQRGIGARMTATASHMPLVSDQNGTDQTDDVSQRLFAPPPGGAQTRSDSAASVPKGFASSREQTIRAAHGSDGGGRRGLTQPRGGLRPGNVEDHFRGRRPEQVVPTLGRQRGPWGRSPDSRGASPGNVQARRGCALPGVKPRGVAKRRTTRPSRPRGESPAHAARGREAAS